MGRVLVALACLLAAPTVLFGQQEDSVSVGLRPSFDFPPLVLREPAILRSPWLGAPRPPAGVRAAAWDSAVAVVRDSARARHRVTQRLATIYAVPLQEQADLEGEAAAERRGLLGISPKYANLAIDGQARLEIRSDRLRNERCTPQQLLDRNSGCRGGFKAPRIENQFNLRSGGIIGRRIHVNVDYDTQRDFNGNNDVQVYYEGLEDEIIRRIEVGTVNFTPPRSRFITAAIPTNNFGVNAQFEVGAFQFQTLAATQKGSVVAERAFTVGQTTSQPQDRQLRDLDFESGRFFWMVDPARLPGYPAVDILNVSPQVVDPGSRPVEVRVYRFRAANSRNGVDPNLGGITAVARRGDSPQRYGPVRWELLIQGTDYYLDPSGLWFALTTKLDVNDYLAVSYRTAAGTTVGSFPAADNPAAADSLEFIVDPLKGPEVPTFRYEMRQIYRVAGTDLDKGSLIVNLAVNRSERPPSGVGTYLSLLGLATPSDANVFDLENRLFPRSRDPGAEQAVKESYIVFPHLTPFADGSKLGPAELSDSLYRTPRYLLLTQGPSAKFQFRLRYNSAGTGDRSSLSLNALQIREGSEQLIVGGRRLERDVDYTISYETGEVTFLNPDALFGLGGVQVTARFEERGVFAVAPTSIFGLSTRYSLGDMGAISLIGMWQREQSPFNRPPLGFEASANLIGGINTELRFRPNGITRFFNSLTSTPSTAPSRFDVNAEVAFTKPDLNRSGEAYLEEFEADAGVPISLREGVWEFGSRPQLSAGLEDIGFGGGFDPADAVQLVWQNLVRGANGAVVELRPQDIDTLIRIAGVGEQLETAMFLTFHADTAGGFVRRNNSSRWSQPARPFQPRWRSMVTALSNTGLDLSRNEYLEFWVFHPGDRSATTAGLRMVFDFGTVNEDALALAPDTVYVATGDTLYGGRQYVGAGVLDTERSSTGIFNAEVDDIGILADRPAQIFEEDGVLVQEPQLCQRELTSTVLVFPWGDLSTRCTAGNGLLDTEDLNGDHVLNAAGEAENVFRYVVDLANSPYYVRDGAVDPQSGSRWSLYRVPIRTPTSTIGTPNLRLIQQLRVTFAAPADAGDADVVARLAVARMRLVGSSWARRTETPVLGLAGITAEQHGEVVASTVSTENLVDLGYTSPPGVRDQVNQRGDIGEAGTQINERSLRVVARDLLPDERAEAYLRFPAGTQSLLNYRELRVWARGRGPGWDEGEVQAFVRLGSDVNNFYQFRAPARTTTWDPEMIIDLEVWRRLRATVEQRWLAGEPPSGSAECGGLPTAYVACEGSYLVHVADPGINPPNLAAVQEVSTGILRVAGVGPIPETEVWIDDIRLSRPVSEVGRAVALDTRLVASDVGDVSVSYSLRDGSFRQINEDATYRTTGVLQMATNWRLDRFLPASFGVAMPLTVTYNRSNIDPELLTGSDLRGDALTGLRKPTAWSTRYSLALRRSVRGASWLTRSFLDPLFATGTVNQGRSQTELSEASANGFNIQLGYNLQNQRRGPRLGLGGLLGGLPKWLRESEAGKGLRDANFSFVPTSIRLSSGLTRDASEFTTFRVPVALPEDAATAPIQNLTHLWRNAAGLTWQPLGMITLSGDLTSTRDLRVYSDSTPIGALAYAERERLLGIPVGVERDRQLSTTVTVSPRISSWLRPRFLTGSSFILSRTLTSREPVQEFGDSGRFILPQTLNNSRTRELGANLDLSRALRGLFGDSSAVSKVLGRLRPIDARTRRTLGSTFDLASFDPSLGYQLGLGGLEDFLSQEGQDAIGASETHNSTITAGADLPYGITTSFSYGLTRTTRYQRLGDRFAEAVSRQIEWPVGSVRWTQTFAGGPFALVAVGTGFRRREGVSTQPSRTTIAVNLTRSSTVTPDLQLSFRNGMSVILGLSSLRQRTETGGNAQMLQQDDINGTFTYSFRLPGSISRQRKQVRSSLTGLSTRGTTCLQRPDRGECTPVSDIRRQEIRGGLDTDLLRVVSAGLQFGYLINDARHLSRRTSQIFLLASFQLSLYAGDYR